MPLTFACECGQHYAVDEQYAGQQVPCQVCNRPLTVPSASGVQATARGPYQPPDDYTAELAQPSGGGGGLTVLLVSMLVIFLFAGSLIGFVVWLAHQEEEQVASTDPPEKVEKPDRKEEKPKEQDPPEKKEEKAKVEEKPKVKEEVKQPPPARKLAPPSDRPWQGHSASVVAVAVDRAGKSVWTASGGSEEGKSVLDSTLRRWDVKTGKESDRLEFPDHGIVAAALAPDANRAAIAGVGRSDIELWDLAAKKKLFTLDEHLKPVRCLAFSADGTRLVSGSDDKTLVVWDVSSGKRLKKLVGHTNFVNSIAVSANGKLAISGGLDHTARLWNLDSGEPAHPAAAHGDIVWASAFSTDGKMALSGGGLQMIAEGIFVAGARDHEVRCWDVDTAKEKNRFSPLTTAVTTLSFSPDGRRFLAGGHDGGLRLWQMGTSKEVKRLDGHSARVRSVAFFADGRRAVSVGEDKTIRVWDLPLDLPDMVRDLKSDDATTRLAALAELARLGAEAKPAITPLFDALSRKDNDWRGRVLGVLRGLSPFDKEHVQRLVRLVEEKGHEDGRLFALDELAKLGEDARPAAKALLAVVGAADVEVRRKALTALVPILDEVGGDAFVPLIGALRDRDDSVRQQAEKAIDKLGAPAEKHLPLVRGLLKDEGAGLRRFAAKALGEMGEPAAVAVGELAERAKTDSSADVRQQALASLSKLASADERTVESATKGLADASVAVNRQAAKALAAARDVPGLVAALDHADEEVNKTASEAMQRVRFNKKQLPLVVQLIESKKVDVRTRGVEAAAALGADATDAVPALSKALKSAEDDEQKRILAALVKMGSAASKAGPAVAKLLETKDRTRKLVICEVLIKIESAEVKQAIAGLIGQLRPTDLEEAEDEEATKHREKVRTVLVQIGKPAIKPLVHAIENEFSGGRDAAQVLNAAARLQSVKALGEMGATAKTSEVMQLLAQMQRSSVEPFSAIREEAKSSFRKVQKK